MPAFVYKPPGRGPHPVIIHVHGGPEAQYRPYFSVRTQLWIAELGAAVIAPNIRGSSGYDQQYLALDNGLLREDAVRDIGALLDWIAEQRDLDENRVAIYGASYGGYLVLASAVHYSDRLRAGVDVVGISNFVSFLENTEDYRRAFRRYEYGDERDPETRAFLERISPLNNVDRIDIPLLVVQGRNDPRVPASESEQIVRALRDRNQPVWYIEALNEGHGYERKENPEGVLLPQEITEFTNAGMCAGIAAVNMSANPREEFLGFFSAASTYGSFSYLKYGAMRLFSQLKQDCPLELGKVIWVAGHSGPETAEDSRTHFGVFAPGVTQLFPDGHVVNLHPWEHNEVAPLLAAALTLAIAAVTSVGFFTERRSEERFSRNAETEKGSRMPSSA